MSPEQEAEKILELYHGDTAKAFDLISNNLQILQTRGHILMTLSGAVLTVSGFSGRLIAGTHLFSQIAIIAGLILVMASSFWIFARVMRIKWLSRHLDLPPVEAIARGIEDRNAKQKHFHSAGILFCIGASFYAVALFVMLIFPATGALAPRSKPNYQYENNDATKTPPENQAVR